MNNKNRFETRISPLRLALCLAAVAVLLLIAHLGAEAVRTTVGEGLPDRATAMWHLGEENNIPTWYASLLFALVSLGLAFVGVMKYQERDPHWWQWFAIALIPLFLSLDDMAQLHEALSDPLSDEYGFSGVFRWAWIVVAAPVVLVLAVLFMPFVRRLPRRTAVLLLCGAGITFGGGVILEMPEGWWFEANGESGVIMFSMVTAQEMLEMIGTIIALYAVIDYAAGYRPELVLHVERDELPFIRESLPQSGEAGLDHLEPAEQS